MKIIKWIKGLFCKTPEGKLEELKKAIDKLKTQHIFLQNSLIECREANNDSGEYWNNKWPKAHITYGLQPGMKYDIRTIFNVTWEEEHELRKITKQWEPLKDDTKVLKILNYVINRLSYVPDAESQNTPEFWQDAYFTYESKQGDCEDGAILIFKLMQLAGVPAYKRKLCAGYVQPSPTAPQGGHAYAIYLADDGQWYALDWCYYPSISLKSYMKKPHNELDYYKNIWWTTNEIWTWNQKDTHLKDHLQP